MFSFLKPSITSVAAGTRVAAIHLDYTDGEPLTASVSAEIKVVKMKLKVLIKTNIMIQKLLPMYRD